MLKKFILFLFCVNLCLARVVIDSEGQEIHIPDKVERASPMVGIFVQIAVSLGNGDKIVSGAFRGLTPMMLKVFPKIKTLGIKSGGGSMGAGVETLIKEKTQVVFGPRSVIFDENIKTQLENAGIAVVSVGRLLSTTKDLKNMVSTIAQIFGDESVEVAKIWEKDFDEKLEFVRSRIDKNAYKKRVLILTYRAGNWMTSTANWISGEYIAIAGGENLAAVQGTSFGYFPSINEEQIIVYNPDIIIVNSQEGKEAVEKNARFKFIKAVKNKQIFVQPRGVGVLWSGTEGGLQVLWLAKILHPDKFKDLDVGAKIREFYEKFYHYKLSDAELSEILEPKEKIRIIY